MTAKRTHLKIRRWRKNKTKTEGTGEQHTGGWGAWGGSKIDFHSSFSSTPLFSLERLPKVFGLMALFLLLIHQIQEGIPKHNASLGSRLNQISTCQNIQQALKYFQRQAKQLYLYLRSNQQGIGTICRHICLLACIVQMITDSTAWSCRKVKEKSAPVLKDLDLVIIHLTRTTVWYNGQSSAICGSCCFVVVGQASHWPAAASVVLLMGLSRATCIPWSTTGRGRPRLAAT